MNPSDTARLPDEVVDAAVGWAVRLHYSQPSPRDTLDFDRWVQSDALHALAWERVSAVRTDVGGLPANTVLGTLQTAGNRSRRRGAVKLLAAAGLAAGCGWLAREHTPWQRALADASTARGEQRTIQLTDGTTLVLDTDSAVRIEWGGERRLLHLLRGQVLVSTGRDALAPTPRSFWVRTPHGELQALGTRFAVRLDGPRVRLSVQEGAVAIYPGGPGASAHAVAQAGQYWWLSPDSAARAEAPGLDAFSWTQGVIAARDMRLADFLTELSRYRPGRIVCDERVAGLRLSGIYHVRDTDAVLQFLVQTQPVRVRLTTRYWVSVGPDLPG